MGRKEVMKILMIVVYLILTVSGLICMKIGGNTGTVGLDNKVLSFSMSIISLIGFVLYIFSFLTFTKIVSMFDLSYIYPIITGIVQIITLVLSALVLKEKLSTQGVIGAIIIILGILVMNIKLPGKA